MGMTKRTKQQSTYILSHRSRNQGSECKLWRSTSPLHSSILGSQVPWYLSTVGSTGTKTMDEGSSQGSSFVDNVDIEDEEDDDDDAREMGDAAVPRWDAERGMGLTMGRLVMVATQQSNG